MKSKNFLVSLIILMLIAGLFILTGCRNNNNDKKEENVNSTSNNIEEAKKDQKEETVNSTSSNTENTKKDKKGEISNSNSNNVETQKTEEGYEIKVSKKDITIEKGTEASFDITFTNPDESSIREYIHCEDQDDIVIVKYSALEDKKITVEVEALKVGVTEIVVCDYNYPNIKEIVKVNVIEKNSYTCK